MSNDPVYVLDSDVFMTAARTYYAFDLAPAFWQGLVQKAQDGRLHSIDRVKDEIDRGKDELAQWAAGDFDQWFVSTEDGSVLAEYRLLMGWAAKHHQFTDAAKVEFADEKNADAWLVAYVKVTGGIVVTNEKFDANIRRKIKIPNVCQAFAVAYVNVFQMLRALGLRLS
ncbi:MAG TPA: DUF4411 family protein [Burkholderiales bacterium]|nr:DUF4411 family protein [Burkholderiales bacterium]